MGGQWWLTSGFRGTLFSDKAKLSKPQGFKCQFLSLVTQLQILMAQVWSHPSLFQIYPNLRPPKTLMSSASPLVTCRSSWTKSCRSLFKSWRNPIEKSRTGIERRKKRWLPSELFTHIHVYIYILYYIYNIIYIIFGLRQQTGSQQSDSSSNISTKTHWVYLQRWVEEQASHGIPHFVMPVACRLQGCP